MWNYKESLNHKKSVPVGGLATVFQAKLLAISSILIFLRGKLRKIRKAIYTCSDSGAAITIAKSTTKLNLVWDCMRALQKLEEQLKVTLMGNMNIKKFRIMRKQISWDGNLRDIRTGSRCPFRTG